VRAVDVAAGISGLTGRVEINPRQVGRDRKIDGRTGPRQGVAAVLCDPDTDIVAVLRRQIELGNERDRGLIAGKVAWAVDHETSRLSNVDVICTTNETETGSILHADLIAQCLAAAGGQVAGVASAVVAAGAGYRLIV